MQELHADSRLRALSLCSGIGAGCLGLARWCRTVGYIERDSFAQAILLAGMENALLDPAPVFSDLERFDGTAWRGVVDIVDANPPCQPYSLAGLRRGNDDERALWPELVRIVRECEPAFVFIENTPDFLSHAEPVWRELRGLGFEWEKPLFATASHVGAIHGRRRVFLLAAHADRSRLAQRRGERGDAFQERATAERSGDGASDPHGQRELEPHDAERAESRGDARALARGRDLLSADPNSPGLESEWCGWVFDGERQTFRHDPERCNPRCRIRGTAWDAQSPVCRVDAGYPYRADLLRVLGNAVPPQQTALAFGELISGFGIEP